MFTDRTAEEKRNLRGFVRCAVRVSSSMPVMQKDGRIAPMSVQMLPQHMLLPRITISIPEVFGETLEALSWKEMNMLVRSAGMIRKACMFIMWFHDFLAARTRRAILSPFVILVTRNHTLTNRRLAIV